MGLESQPCANSNERPANGEPPSEKPIFPLSRRSFLKAAGTVALSAAIGKRSAHREKQEPKKDDPARELLTKGKIQTALEDLRKRYPATWERVWRNKTARSIEYIAGFIAANERKEKNLVRTKTGAALGVAGLDMAAPLWIVWRRAIQKNDPGTADRELSETQKLYTHPVEIITKRLKNFAFVHAVRSGVAAVSGGLTALASELLSAKPATDPEIQKRALEMATETLLTGESVSPEREKFREDMLQYILTVTHRVQPWIEENTAVTDPIAIWSIGSYYAASELAAYNQQANQSGAKDTAGPADARMRGS